MAKPVTSTYLTQESRQVGAEIVWAVTYQKTAAVKATIPNSEIMRLPVISNAIGRDFLALSGGDVQLSLDNRSRQWDDTYASAYNVAKYDGDLRIHAGFRLPGGSSELVELFSGKIVNIEMSGVTPRDAVITARNPMANRISKYTLGKSVTGSTPLPYIRGKRTYEPLFQQTAGAATFYVNHKGTLSNLGAQVFKQSGEKFFPRALTLASLTANLTTKTIRYTVATPGVINWVTISKNPSTNPAYVIKDILTNYVGIPATQLNATSFDRIAGLERAGGTINSYRFQDMGAMEAVERICHFVYAAAFVEGHKINIVSLGSPISNDIHLNDQDYEGMRIALDKSRIINHAMVPVYEYPIKIPGFFVASNNTQSQASYGTLSLSAYYPDFSYAYLDPIQVMSYSPANSPLLRLGRTVNTILKYNAHAKRIFTLSGVYSKGFRIELGDRLRVSSSFFNINQASAVVISKTVDLARKRTDLMLLSWP